MGVLAITGFTALDNIIHGGDLREDLSQHFMGRCSTWESDFRRLPALRHVPQSNHKRYGDPLFKGWLGYDWLSHAEAPFESFHCASVGEIEMFHDFCGTPLPCRMACQVLRRHAAGQITDDVLESLQVEIHRVSLRFV